MSEENIRLLLGIDDKLGADIPQECIDGGNAFADGIKIEDNPYDINTKQYKDWELGWYNAEGYQQFLDGKIP